MSEKPDGPELGAFLGGYEQIRRAIRSKLSSAERFNSDDVVRWALTRYPNCLDEPTVRLMVRAAVERRGG
jgi:hypothetical protein